MKTLPIRSPESLLPHFRNVTERLFYVVGIKTGFRIAELLSLTVSDVYFPSGEVKKFIAVERKNMKGKMESRAVPLSDATRKVLADQGLPENLSFPHAKLFPFTSRTGNNILNRAWAKTQREGRVANHSMRKTFAARVWDLSRNDLRITQKAMGHANINSTISYLEVDQDKLDKVFEEL